MVEILFIVAILAILITIQLPKSGGVQDQAYISRAQGELKAIQLGVTSYYMNRNPHAYPPTTTTLTASYLTSATPRIIKDVLYDPFGATATTEYTHKLSTNGKYYIIYSLGAGRQGSATISDNGTGTISNNPICVSNVNVNGCLKGAGSGTDACGGCKGGKHCCSGTCVDFNVNGNCGACGVTCGAGQGCCGGVCKDLQTDANNCGSCGTVCNYGCTAGACDPYSG